MSKTSLQTFGLFLGLAAIVAGAPLLWSLGAGGNGSRAGLAVGSKAPAIEGGGWINAEDPESTNVRGKVVVVNAWSLTCPQCEKGLPELVGVYDNYKEKGVVFLGLSTDRGSRVSEMESYLAKYKAAWPNAYDALASARAFKVEYIPGYWVIDRNGIVVWNKASKEAIGEAIDKALKPAT